MTFPLWLFGAKDRGDDGSGAPSRSQRLRAEHAVSRAGSLASANTDAASSLRVARLDRERQWVDALRRGDLAAFEAIYIEYFPLLWRLAVRSVDESAAEDVVHDVFVTVWDRRAEAAFDDYLGPYLVAALRSRVHERFRHDRVVREAEERMDPDLPPGLGMADDAPDRRLALRELEAAIAAALHQLPERQRHALVLRWYHRMSYDDIAQALGMSVIAARQLVSRTHKIVRPLLDRFR